MTSRHTEPQQLGLAATPIKKQYGGTLVEQHGPCPDGSPVSGLCSAATAPARPFARGTLSGSHLGNANNAALAPALRTGPLFGKPKQAAQLSPRQGPTASMTWAPVGSSTQLSSSTSSMPELWQRQATGQYVSVQQQQHAGHHSQAADSTPSRDQRFCASNPDPSQQVQQLSKQDWQQSQQFISQNCQEQALRAAALEQSCVKQHEPRTASAPMDVLLAPLLPSADEGKVLERLSQLRQALDEQRRLAAGWELQVG